MSERSNSSSSEPDELKPRVFIGASPTERLSGHYSDKVKRNYAINEDETNGPDYLETMERETFPIVEADSM